MFGKVCSNCSYQRKPSDNVTSCCPKCGVLYAKSEGLEDTREEQLMAANTKTFVKTYVGSQAEVTVQFQNDAIRMAEKRYFPTSQSWAPGAYEWPAFLVAILLCFVIIGFLAFLYMLLVKPNGTLTVTYELRKESQINHAPSFEEKTCPKCAEQVKAAAQICRYCDHNFV